MRHNRTAEQTYNTQNTMWLFTTIGFYSITQSTDDRSKIQIRARVKQDIINLRREAKIKAPLLETEASDYRYRVIVSPWKAARVMGVLFRLIDYTNFKSAVATHPDQRAKLHGLHEIWATHLQWQPRRQHRPGSLLDWTPRPAHSEPWKGKAPRKTGKSTADHANELLEGLRGQPEGQE